MNCRIALLVLLLIVPGVAQHKALPYAKPKPAPQMSETVARECFVLMQFITEHGKEDAYETFISQEIDRLRMFNLRDPDQEMIDLLEQYAFNENSRAWVESRDVPSALIDKAIACRRWCDEASRCDTL